MTEQQTQMDTPQVEQPRNEQGQFVSQDSVVDDVIFGSQPPEALEAFPAGEETSVPQEGQPEVQEQLVTPQPETATATDNEEVRYQYWQSQADKSKNQLEQMRQTNQLLQNQLNVLSTQQPQAQAQAESNEFPPPPERPQKPRAFSREEAYTDPTSESAQYLDDVDSWRDNMDEYNRLHSQYQQELVAVERAEMQEAMKREQNIRLARQQEYQTVQNLKQQVQQNFGADENTAMDFINKFSSDESISLDNLWKLYQMENSGQAPAQPMQTNPSPTFQQTARAQQATTPMGVVTGQSQQATGSAEDRIMDSMVSNYKSKNPF